jgi:tetratricopeptide (TPR) repeat protein
LKLRVSILFIAFLAVGFLACSVAARAQHHRGDETGAPPEALRTDLGSLHHPIATTSPDAQKFFDQGLTLIYAFNHGEAIRSFRRAAELDPKSPMPYWGIALALGPNYNETTPEDEKAPYEAIQKAQELAATAPEVERAYVNALARRFTNESKRDYDKLARDYAAGMRDLSRQYPDDPDAGTLYAESLMDQHAWALWTNDGKAVENTLEIVSVLEAVLRRWPDHVGANHYYIHALEMAPDPERALPSAHRLETLVPGAGHLVHMPSHIYMRTGDYAAAVKSNQDAIAVDKKMLARPGAGVYMVYRSHNVHFLTAAAMMDGEYDVALDAAKDLETRANAMVADLPMAESFLPWHYFVLLRFARWDDILAIPVVTEKTNAMAFFSHYAHAVAFAAKGKIAEAQAERASIEDVYKKIPPASSMGMSYNNWQALHEVADHTLAARIAAARGKLPEAIAEWRAAVDAQDRMNYDEPADWYYPVRESLGAALLASGDAAAAEKVFRQDLDRDNPRNPRSLYGLWKTLEAQKKTVDADWVRASFQAAWKGPVDQLRLSDF